MTSHAITKWPQPHGMTRVVGGKEIEGKNGFGDCCFLSTMYISQTSLHIVWKISRNVSFFYNNKIIFDFQIFEFFKRFKTCYIFYDFNTLCSGSSSTGIMRFAFKLVGGTALVFPGFQLWGAKLENPFFFSTALYQSLFHKPFSCPLSFTLDVITVISQGSANKTLYFSVLLSGFFLVLKGKRPFFFFNVNAVVRLRRQGLSWATTIFPACLFFRKPKSMGQQKKLTVFFTFTERVFASLSYFDLAN